jgi:AcrR family transcriptional regulator
VTTSRRVLDEQQLLLAARRAFDAHGTVDMDALARDLAVSRATLYRVAGSRERLLGEVLWASGSRAMAHHRRDVPGGGPERLVELARRFNAGLLAYEPVRRFVHDDPTLAFRVLFMPEARVHSRFVGLWRELLGEAVAAGELDPPFDVDELAFVFVRLGESLLYSDLLSGLEPDVELCARVQSALLTSGQRSLPTPGPSTAASAG